MNTNFINMFAEKVKNITGTNSSITLTNTEAKNLNYEIQQLLMELINRENNTQFDPIDIEIKSSKF